MSVRRIPTRIPGVNAFERDPDNPYTQANRPVKWTPPTHAQIGKSIGLSRARVQQIEARAIEKIRAGLLKDPAILEWLKDNGIAPSDTPTSAPNADDVIGKMHRNGIAPHLIARELDRLGVRMGSGSEWTASFVTSRITTLEGRRAMQKGTP